MRRVIKVFRDIWRTRGRVLFMALALSAGLTSMGAVLSMRMILLREMTRNYLESIPASASIDVGESGILDTLMNDLRRRPEVAKAERRTTREGRWRLPGGKIWGRALLFVIEDFEKQELALIEHESGAHVPPLGTVLVERSAMQVLGRGIGDTLEVVTSAGRVVDMTISGIVHEPALAPAVSEQAGYFYMTKETLALLGETPTLDEVRILVAENPLDKQAVETQVASIAGWLRDRKVAIHDIRIPPPGEHPHEAPSQTVLLLFAIFSGLTVLLSGILSASLLAITMARQVREIAVMKTLGATSLGIGALYALMLGIVSLLAIVISLVPTWIIGRIGVDSVAALLNLDIASYAVPRWVPCLQIGVGIALPLLTAGPAIIGAARVSVQTALTEYGVREPQIRNKRFLRRLENRLVQAALLNTVRVRRRFVLTLGLLAVGGALFVTAVSLADSWQKMTDKVFETRHYDVELHLAEPMNASLLKELKTVKRLERWGSVPVTLASASGLPISRTYPDGGHGSFHMVATPDRTELVDFTLRAGRQLIPGETNGVVLNQLAAERVGEAPLGKDINLVVEGRMSTWRVVGIVDEVATPAVAYVSRNAFEANTGKPLTTLRVAADNTELKKIREPVEQRVAREVSALGGKVIKAVPLQLLYNAMGEHVVVLIRSLIALAVMMAFVGILALGSTMSTNVVERTRELGVLRAIGARPGQVKRMVLVEGWFLSLVSLPVALLLAIPLTDHVAVLVGELAFKLPLPLDISWSAFGIWCIGMMLVSTMASALPARTAAKLSVTESLGHV